MGYKRAIILGNGEGRRHVDIPDDCDVWGCNYIYKENIDLDFLVATDVHTQHNIYCSKYPVDNTCYFLGWDILDSNDITPGIVASTGAMLRENEYTDYGVVVGGDSSNIMYFTYLQEDDNVIPIKESELPMEFSSGSLAMYLAGKSGHYNEIILAGFGDDEHIYEENNVPNKEVWKKEREYIIRYFSDMKWRYI